MLTILRNPSLCYIGSLTWDALAGKIMFRDIVYTTQDFSIRVQDGWLVFRWWRSYVPKDISEGMFFLHFNVYYIVC